MSWWSIINCERVQSQRCGNDAGMTVLVQWQENDYGIDLCCLFVYARGILAALVGLARCRVVVGSGNGRERRCGTNWRARASDRGFLSTNASFIFGFR